MGKYLSPRLRGIVAAMLLQWHHPMPGGTFLRVRCIALLQHQQFLHKVVFGLQTAFSKAVNERRKERRDVSCQDAWGTDTQVFSAQAPQHLFWDTLLLLLVQTTQLPRF